MLETTGMNSASARLQHASLPSLGSASRTAAWEDDDGQLYQAENSPQRPSVHESQADGDAEGSNFEDGVVAVHSELPVFEPGLGDNGYDLLPLPVPAPERRILSAGNNECEATFLREGRFHYGTGADPSEVQVDSDDKKSRAFLGDIAVDENIGKLREVIGSVENTLARCLASIGGVAKSQSERQALHVEVVSGLDSWGGMRGKFVSQRSLLKGVSGIELCKELYAEGDTAMIDGKFAWTQVFWLLVSLRVLTHCNRAVKRHVVSELAGQIRSLSRRRRSIGGSRRQNGLQRQGCRTRGGLRGAECM
jgi:hypothetical protein